MFEGNRDSIRLWNDVADRLGDTRIEVSTGIAEAHLVPWELLRDPRTDAPLALTAREFVRVQSQAGRAPLIPAAAQDGPVRLLIAICRPSGADDVPFRSVASRLVKALTEAGASAVSLHVLRPPTFEELGRVLRRARSDGRPFHIVHFDGHGLFVGDAERKRIEQEDNFDSSGPAAPGAGPARGYICFEDAARSRGVRLVDGATLGNLLYEASVPALVLNACRSGLGLPPPDEAAPDAKPVRALEDQVRAYGSFAQAVVDAGVAGVIAMRYNVYVVTAAQFVGELYQTLAEGESLGQAATRARKHLGDERVRAVGGKRILLQDWPVPTVHEAAPIRLFPKREVAALFDRIDWTPSAALPGELPHAPDIGFIGRDETLMALDRGFDRHRTVLLHGLAGAGKTTTAAEFARWYGATGGVPGPVLFDSFERYTPLPRLLDHIGRVFGAELAAQGVPWVRLGDAERRRITLQILSMVPLVWIWDNVEQVAGFPSGTESVWTPAEQQELADFLRDLAGTKAKVLLTSRRDEAAWLGDLPARVRIPPLPRLERLQFAEALLGRHGGEASLVEAMEPLLDVSRGNPLTLGVVLRQAMREGIRTREGASALADRLRDGEAAFDDDEEQGRSRSLGASLSYGFAQGFDEAERKRLALLHLFQGIAWDAILAAMEARMAGDVARPDPAPWRSLLSRAAENGLVTREDQGIFAIHPALPWFFENLFGQHYPDQVPADGEAPALRAERAYVLSVLGMVRAVSDAGDTGKPVSGLLRALEANLLHARRLAERHRWWAQVIEATRRLADMYAEAGRRTEHLRTIRACAEQLLDRATLTARPGFEAHWFDGMQLAHRLAVYEHQPAEGRRMHDAVWDRLVAVLGDPRKLDLSKLTPEQLAQMGAYLTVVRSEVGTVVERKAAAELPEAARLAERAYDIACALGADEEAAGQALNLGHCYTDQGTQDRSTDAHFDTAEQWYLRALEKLGPSVRPERLRCLSEIAQLGYARFQNAMARKAAPQELQERLNAALEAARSVERQLPKDYPAMRVNSLLLLGNIFDDGGMLTGDPNYFTISAEHYDKAIQIADRIEDQLAVSLACRAMARSKVRQAAFPDAVVYVEEAMRRAERAGSGGLEALALSKKLAAAIMQASQAAGRRPT